MIEAASISAERRDIPANCRQKDKLPLYWFFPPAGVQDVYTGSCNRIPHVVAWLIGLDIEEGDGGYELHSTPATAMSPATSAQVRRRQAARRDALERQQRLNEERRVRDEAEVELAAEFALRNQERKAACEAIAAAEIAMGRVVEQLIGPLRICYPRAAQLLEMPEDELRRLRQRASESPSVAEDANEREHTTPIQ